jgi:hypothetical protein
MASKWATITPDASLVEALGGAAEALHGRPPHTRAAGRPTIFALRPESVTLPPLLRALAASAAPGG